jgi:hypothetical protein
LACSKVKPTLIEAIDINLKTSFQGLKNGPFKHSIWNHFEEVMSFGKIS